MNSSVYTTPTIQPISQNHPPANLRRKPRTTYKSPSREDSYDIGPCSLMAISQNHASSSATPQSTHLKAASTPVQLNGLHASLKRKKYPMGPPLPLYHPLGRLALSLPPLDPASVGLPTPLRSDDAARRSSARARRPVAKLRDVEIQDEVLVAPVTNTPLLDVEAREKPSPRKRRGGGGAKRKRKEVDDGDATYPAKRTRMPRGAVNQPVVGDEDPPESIMAEVTPTPEPLSEVPDDKKPERRSTRSRGSAKRRDSSASDAASSISTEVVGPTQERDSMEVDKNSDIGVSIPVEEKEEGELSDEGQPLEHGLVNPS